MCLMRWRNQLACWAAAGQSSIHQAAGTEQPPREELALPEQTGLAFYSIYLFPIKLMKVHGTQETRKQHKASVCQAEAAQGNKPLIGTRAAGQ